MLLMEATTPMNDKSHSVAKNVPVAMMFNLAALTAAVEISQQKRSAQRISQIPEI